MAAEHRTRDGVLILVGVFTVSTLSSYATGTYAARVIYAYKYAKVCHIVKPPRKNLHELLHLPTDK